MKYLCLHKKITCVLILLPVLLDGSVQGLDEVVDMFAATNWISNELQSIGNRNLLVKNTVNIHIPDT